MDRRKVDYIIVGQGIAGTWLSFELLKRGYKILVINDESENTASLVAAGLFNPITGRKMVKTWIADRLFPSLSSRYHEIEQAIEDTCFHLLPIYRPFVSVEEGNDWESRKKDEEFRAYIKQVRHDPLGIVGLSDEIGGVILNYSGYVDLPKLLTSFRNYLVKKEVYLNSRFDYELLDFNNGIVNYDQWEANKVIFCEGPNTSNPYWKDLPFKPVRGEVIDVEIGIPADYIINRGVFMVPKNGYFTVGSTYDHSKLTFEPQEDGIINLTQRLSKLYTGSYRIIDKRAGIRPATYDRRPFIGLHPKKETLGIFNGFGTKGVSLTPYFATQYVDYLEGSSAIDEEADVQRVF